MLNPMKYTLCTQPKKFATPHLRGFVKGYLSYRLILSHLLLSSLLRLLRLLLLLLLLGPRMFDRQAPDVKIIADSHNDINLGSSVSVPNVEEK